MLSTLLGASAAAISFIMWIPQAATTWRHRRDPGALAGISAGTSALVLLNAAIWGAYAIALGEFWVGAPGLINGPLALMTLWLLRRRRRGVQPTQTAGAVTTDRKDAASWT